MAEISIQNVDSAALEKIFRDKPVVGNIRRIARARYQEAGFSVYRHEFRDYQVLSKVSFGDRTSLSSYEDFQNSPDSWKYVRPVMKYHSHGEVSEGLIIPSLSDLEGGDLDQLWEDENRYNETGLDYPIIGCISRFTGKPEIPVLMIQRSALFFSRDQLEDICKGLSKPLLDAQTQLEIVDAINESGFYRAALVTFGQNGFDDNAMQEINQFAFNPIISDQRKVNERLEIVRELAQTCGKKKKN